MQFLDDTLRMRPTTSNINTNEIEDSVSLQNEHQELQRESEENETQETPLSPDMPPPPPQKRKAAPTAKDTSHITEVDKIINYFNNKTAKRDYDGIDNLFLSYADTFRKFQPATQAMLKMELATLFARTEMRELEGHIQRPVLPTSQSPLHLDSSHSSTRQFASGDTSPTYQDLNSIPFSSADSSCGNARELYESYGSHFQLN